LTHPIVAEIGLVHLHGEDLPDPADRDGVAVDAADHAGAVDLLVPVRVGEQREDGLRRRVDDPAGPQFPAGVHVSPPVRFELRPKGVPARPDGSNPSLDHRLGALPATCDRGCTEPTIFPVRRRCTGVCTVRSVRAG
jgi:hypothetical protein